MKQCGIKLKEKVSLRLKKSKIKHENTCNKIFNEKEIIFVKVENKMIYYTTITEKSITQPYNKISYSKYIILLKAYNYYVNNIIRTIND